VADSVDRYAELHAGFRWQVPADFNIAEVCCARWARERPDSVAIRFEAEDGTRTDFTYGELDCAAGILGHLRGADLMPVLLNAADRPLFLGSRPTPFDGADGYPALLEPLQ